MVTGNVKKDINTATTQGGGGGELCPLTKEVEEGRFSEHCSWVLSFNRFNIGKKMKDGKC